MRPALTIRMENQPGTGAATFRKLANAGVNADLLLPVRVSDALFFAVICVDDQDKDPTFPTPIRRSRNAWRKCHELGAYHSLCTP